MAEKTNKISNLSGIGAPLRLQRVCREFVTPAGVFRALKDVDLEVQAGEVVAVVGPSGSGKSTLLHLIAGIDRPSAGEITVAGHALRKLSEDSLTRFRGRTIGIVFQFFQLLPTLTSIENVLAAMDFVGIVPARERRARARALLERVGVRDQADKLPATLSGGQQQRVAIARALANDPPLVVADEPTGNLDSRTAEQVMALLAGLAELGKTVLVVTHERDLSMHFGRVVELADGSVAADRILARADQTGATRCTA